ncbi:MAG: hypothetical protein J0L84_07745 [Verrucomicrobia bacterium]|nr:hypothetical protein [Verrucomicrobiota bacterium]
MDFAQQVHVMIKKSNPRIAVICLCIACTWGIGIGVADEVSVPVLTALEDTTIRGIVDTSAGFAPSVHTNAIPEPGGGWLCAGMVLCALAIWRRTRG